MPNSFNSSFTGEHNDEYDDRIEMLKSQINSLDDALTSFKNQVASTYATKTQLNSMSMVPSANVITLSRTISNNTSSWRNFMADYTPTVNGYLVVYFSGASNTPSFSLYDTADGNYSYRGNGNGSRDIVAILPCRAGRTYNGNCVYCYPSWIRYYTAVQI